MSITSYFENLGKDIANTFTSIGQSTSFDDFVHRATVANNQFATDLVGGATTPNTIPTATPIALPTASLPTTSPVAVISGGIANAVDKATDALNALIPATSPAATTIHQVTDAIDIIAQDAANATVAITNSGSVAKIATTAIDQTMNTITDLVTHFDTTPQVGAITHAVNSVVDNITNIADATLASVANPTQAVHSAVQVLDAVSGITTAITDAVVATNDPTTLDQNAIKGVHDFANFVQGIDSLPTTIGGALSSGADQLNTLIHGTANPVLGQIGDGIAIVAHDIGVGLSDVVNTSSVAHIVTGSLDIAISSISDLVAHFSPDPAAAGIAHTVNSVVDDTTDIVNTIYDAVSGGDVLGASNVASQVIGSVAHIGQTIGEQVTHAYVPTTPALTLPIEPVII